MSLRFAALAALPLALLPPADPCTQQAKLPTAAQHVPLTIGDAFGTTVVSEENRLFVAAPFAGDFRGAVFFFLHNGTDWVYAGRLAPSELQPNDLFGTSLSLKGDLLAVGAPFADDGAGAVFVYEFGVSGVTTTKLSPPTQTQSQDSFGRSVSISDGRIAIGAVNAQVVYVYEQTTSGWGNPETIADPTNNGESFGEAVSLEGDLLVVGDDRYEPFEGAGKPGIAYLFQWDGNQWDLVRTLPIPAPFTVAAPHYGEEVAIQAPWILVGAPRFSDDTLIHVGAVFAFELDPQGAPPTWQMLERPTALQGEGDLFGNALAIRSSRALVGAPWTESGVGSAYQFDLVNGSWTFTSELERRPNEEEQSDHFGSSVAIGSFGIIGMPNQSLGGRAYVWELCD